MIFRLGKCLRVIFMGSFGKLIVFEIDGWEVMLVIGILLGFIMVIN